MIIAVTGSDAVELRDRDNFRDFKVVVEPPGLSVEALATALSMIARLAPEENVAWVFQAALLHWGRTEQPAEWQASFNAMIASARRFGWVNDRDGSIRAHVERVAG